MFWSSTIIRELVLNLAKVIFMCKTFGGITSIFIMRLCGSMSWNGVCVACCAEGTACNTHLFHDMLPHNRIINNDVIPPNVLHINITLARFSTSSLMMVEDRNM